MGVLCGVDIIEIGRIEKSLGSLGDSFRYKVFTEREVNYCESKKAVKYQSYAARFASKEAVSKALGTGISGGISLKDIEVLNDDMGKPYVELSGKSREVFQGIKGCDISLSLSHCENYAVAYAVILTN